MFVAPVDVTGCGTALAAARPHVAALARGLQERFDVVDVTATGNDEDHAIGLAVDFYFPDRDDGDEFARYLINNRRSLGVNYVMWRSRVNIAGTWFTMRSRGTVNASHFDHVHVSFRGQAPGEVPECEKE